MLGDLLHFAPGFAVIIRGGEENEIIQHAAVFRIADGLFRIGAQVGVAHGQELSVRQGDGLGVIRDENGEGRLVKAGFGSRPSFAAVKAAGDHGGAVHAFEGLADHIHGQQAAVGALTGGGEECLAAAELGQGIFVNDMRRENLHNKPPNGILITSV